MDGQQPYGQTVYVKHIGSDEDSLMAEENKQQAN